MAERLRKPPAPGRFEAYLVTLDPVVGSEIAKTRPCVVVSPDRINVSLATALIVPLTSRRRGWEHRVALLFDGVRGELCTEQLRAVSRERLGRFLGVLDPITARRLATSLQALFAF